MRPQSSIWLSIALGISTLGSTALAHQVACRGLVVTTLTQEDSAQVWKNDRLYLQAMQDRATYGQVKTFYSSRFQTQMYYAATAIPNSKGDVQLVDPNSKAVYVFFHGSGTSRSSGRNFISNMNNLANMGFSAVSFDLPHHAQGPTSEYFEDANNVMTWLRSIILELKKSGKPVILAGHSFGPDIALEYAFRFPRDIDGVAGLSPAGFTEVLDHWYDNFTTKMKFGGDVPQNEAGGSWAYKMSKQFLWSKGKLQDPTIVNPKIRIRVLSGDREEYVPAPLHPVTLLPVGANTYDVSEPLKKLMKNAVITIEPGIGHYLFEHADKDGYNVVARELLLAGGYNPADAKAYVTETQSHLKNMQSPEKLALKYSQDPFFQIWADMKYGKGRIPQMAAKQKEEFAKKVFDDFVEDQKARDAEIFSKLLATRETNPDFYNKYKTTLDAAKKVEGSLFMPYLIEVLQKSAN